MEPEKTKRLGSPLLFIISGPAGSGKTTLCHRLLREFPSIRRAVTATTRNPRSGEIDGKDYHFHSREEFDEKVRRSEMLEWALVHGRAYGTPKQEVEKYFRENRDVLLNIDVQGMKQILEQAPSYPWLKDRVVTVFILPPSLEVLQKRLESRGTDSAMEIERRLETAREEMKSILEFDYCLRTESKEEDFDRIRSVYRAEKMRI